MICLADDRKVCEPALRLLLITLKSKSANVPVALFYPPADKQFCDWLTRLGHNGVLLRTDQIPDAYGWNNKPHALLMLLKEGFSEVIWIDSDILVTKDIATVVADLKPEELVVTEEALLNQNDRNALRARMWGFPVGRAFPFALNSCVMRVTKKHGPLLERWKTYLNSSPYRSAQQQTMLLRPIHMFSDQDVLTALLCSEQFSDIPVRILRRGRDIIQYYEQTGFTFAERMGCVMNGMPIFIHQQGWKPWISGSETRLSGLRGRLIAAHQDLSPYTIIAHSLTSGKSESWMGPRSSLSVVLRKIGCGYPPLTGLPTAIVFDLERFVFTLYRIAKYLVTRMLGVNGARLRKNDLA